MAKNKNVLKININMFVFLDLLLTKTYIKLNPYKNITVIRLYFVSSAAMYDQGKSIRSSSLKVIYKNRSR